MKTCRFFILLIVGTFLCVNGENVFKEQCKLSNNCSCTPAPNYSKYEFFCPEEEPKVVIKINPRIKQVTVVCMEEINWETQNLPLMELKYIKHLKIVQCPLPKDSFFYLLQRMGINSTNTLEFTNSMMDNDTILTSGVFKGIENIKELAINNNDLENIDKDAFVSLGEITLLELKFNNFTLAAGLFKQMKKLKSLELSGNKFSNLPFDIFEDLTQLERLYLRSNNISYIQSNTFNNLVNLSLLELSLNKLKEIPENAFLDLENLKTLSLSGNELRYLPANLFRNTKSILNIYMCENPGLILPNNLFSNLSKLAHVDLNGCKINNLPAALFDGSANIKTILLNKNELEEISNYIFNDLKELESLDISYNKLKDLPTEVFSKNTKLKSLNLANNLLTQIRNTFFKDLSKLETLNLENNKISVIEPYSFERIKNLNEIILAHNFIDLKSLLTAPFTLNENLKKIDLSHNNVTDITEDLTGILSELEELDLSYNQISHIEFRDILTLSSPIKIDLSHNQITTIDFANAVQETKNNDFKNQNERKISLKGNPIKCNCFLNDFIKFLDLTKNKEIRSLIDIDLSNLNCTTPEKYSKIPIREIELNMLTCSPNDLGISAVIPDNCTSYEVRPWDRSLIIDCKNANLTKAPILILPESDEYDEVEVNLEGNELISAPTEDMGYDNVTRLYLSSNNIRDISWIPSNIKILELHNNNISRIRDSILSSLNVSSFINLTLGNNPWICDDCSVTELTGFLTSSNIAHKQIDVDNITCKNSGKHIISLKIEEICRNEDIYVTALYISSFLLLLIIIVLWALYCSFKQEIKVWLFAHHIFLWLVQEEELDKYKKYDAFISYSHKDEEFVVKQLQPVLESGSNRYRLCLHVRDWIAGEFISKQIVDSIANSRRTIVILSRNYLESEWGKMEFRIAHEQALKEKRTRVILVLYGEIDPNTDLDEEFKAYIKTNTYVKWEDPWFWDKLRYALPHLRNEQPRKHKNLLVAIRRRIGKLGDRRTLIRSTPTTPIPASTPPVLSLDPLELKKSPLDFTPQGV